jgi:hypothetical protein
MWVMSPRLEQAQALPKKYRLLRITSFFTTLVRVGLVKIATARRNGVYRRMKLRRIWDDISACGNMILTLIFTYGGGFYLHFLNASKFL